jgi:hypothetical protein
VTVSPESHTVEFEVAASPNGGIDMVLFEDNDDMLVITLSVEDAWFLASAIAEAAQAEENR